MNNYTGQSPINIGGSEYTLCFDWAALSKVKTLFTDTIWQNLNGIDPLVLADLLAIGLEKNHPTITKQFIITHSPPLIPSIQALDKAVGLAYFGPDGMPDQAQPEAKKKKKKMIYVLLFALLSISALALMYFGG